jgi:photosystem II stability/assembly factor-like uncharacterized protein
MDEMTLVRELVATDADPAPAVLDHARELLHQAYDAPGTQESKKFRRPISNRRFVPDRRLAPVLGVAALVAAAVVLPLTIGHSPNAGNHAISAGDMQMQLVASDTSPFQAVGTDPGAFSLQCVTDSTCYGTSGSSPVGGSPVIYRTDNGGSTWVATAALPDLLDAPLACSSATDCLVAVTGIPAPGGSLPADLPIARTTDGGTHWVVSSLVLPAQLAGASVGQVACATTGRCVVYVSVTYNSTNSPKPTPGAFFTTSDAGSTWTESAPVAGITENDVSTIRCAADGDCVGVVVNGSVPDFTLSTVNSMDYGANWVVHPSTPIASAGGTIRTVCGDTQHCFMVYPSQSGMNISIARTADGGATWTVASAPTSWRSYPLDLSCPTGTDCYVSTANNTTTFADPIIEATTDAGATWTTLGLPTVHGSALGSVQPLSCPTVDGCLGVAALLNQPSSALVSSLPATTHESTPLPRIDPASGRRSPRLVDATK